MASEVDVNLDEFERRLARGYPLSLGEDRALLARLRAAEAERDAARNGKAGVDDILQTLHAQVAEMCAFAGASPDAPQDSWTLRDRLVALVRERDEARAALAERESDAAHYSANLALHSDAARCALDERDEAKRELLLATTAAKTWEDLERLYRTRAHAAEARVAELEALAVSPETVAMVEREVTSLRARLAVLERVASEAAEIAAYPCVCDDCWTKRNMHDPKGCIWAECGGLRDALAAAGIDWTALAARGKDTP